MLDRHLRTLAIVSAVYLMALLTLSLTGQGFSGLAVYAAFATVLGVNLLFHFLRRELD